MEINAFKRLFFASENHSCIMSISLPHTVSMPIQPQSEAQPEHTAPFKYGSRHIVLNVRVLMAKAGYRDVSKLYRDLLKLGCTISYSQFKRIVDGSAEKLNTDVLDALINLFECEISDLFTVLRAKPSAGASSTDIVA